MGRTKGSKNKPKSINQVVPGMEDVSSNIKALGKKENKKFNDALDGKRKRGRPRKVVEGESPLTKAFKVLLPEEPRRKIRPEVLESKYADQSICTACKNKLKNCNCI